MDAASFLIIVMISAAVGILTALSFGFRIVRLPSGKRTESIRSLGRGTFTMMKREHGVSILTMGALTVLIAFFNITIAATFFVGALLFFTLLIITTVTIAVASSRIAEAARESAKKADRIALLSSTALGLLLTGGALLSLTAILYVEYVYAGKTWDASIEPLIGLCGGIAGALLILRNTESAPTEETSVLLLSFVSSLFAAMLLGWSTIGTEAALFFPLVITGFSILSCIIAGFFVRMGKRAHSSKIIMRGILLSTLFTIAAGYIIAQRFFPDAMANGVTIAFVMGPIASLLLTIITQYYSSLEHPPGRLSPAEANARSIAFGHLSTAAPILIIAFTIGIADIAAGTYGIALAALSVLTPLSLSLSLHVYEGMAIEAERYAKAHHQSAQASMHLIELAVTGKNLQKGSRVSLSGILTLTACALLFIFMRRDASGIALSEPMILIGLILGGTLPFLFSSLTKGGRDHAVSAVFVLLIPLLVGFIFGSPVLTGFLTGAIITGVPLAISTMMSGGTLSLRNSPHHIIGTLLQSLIIISILTTGWYSEGGLLS